jgi:glutamine synthetase
MHLRKVPNDLLSQCDIFHIAKHAIKYVAFNHEYDISNVPIDSAGVFNDLVLTVEGCKGLSEENLQNILYFCPNVNSIRRIKKRKNG